MGMDLPQDSLAWNLEGLPGAISEASYFTAAKATQFRLIVSVLFDEQAHRLTGVAEAELPELIRTRLETELDAVHADVWRGTARSPATRADHAPRNSLNGDTCQRDDPLVTT